jgi:hypothetical protein
MIAAIERGSSKGWQGQAAPWSSNGARSGWNLYQVVAVGVAVSIQQIQTWIYGFRRVAALSQRFQFKIPHITPEPTHPLHLYQKIYCTYSYKHPWNHRENCMTNTFEVTVLSVSLTEPKLHVIIYEVITLWLSLTACQIITLIKNGSGKLTWLPTDFISSWQKVSISM